MTYIPKNVPRRQPNCMIMHFFPWIGHGKITLCNSKIITCLSFDKNCLKYYFQKNNFRVCGKNDQENLPNNLESFENEISIFFRSSLKDSGRGMNCSYRVIEKELKPAKLYNGEGNYIYKMYIF